MVMMELHQNKLFTYLVGMFSKESMEQHTRLSELYLVTA